MDFPDLMDKDWIRHTNNLKYAHIKLIESPNELIWDHPTHELYIPNMGYQHLISTSQEGDPPWWKKGIWKLKCPLK